MKISTLINRLLDVQRWAGGEDLEVVIKEHNGMFNTRFEVGGDSSVTTLGEEADRKVCIISSLIRLG